jgi:hypothetical protein
MADNATDRERDATASVSRRAFLTTGAAGAVALTGAAKEAAA